MLFLALLLAASTTFAQKKSDKTLVKTMDPKGTSSVNFEFRNKGIEFATWDEAFIRVELEVTANFPEAVLAQLVKAGRYTLSSEIDGESFKVKAANLDKSVSIGGTDLDDQVRVFIKGPAYYAVSDDVLQKSFSGDDVANVVARSGTMEEASKIIQKMRQIGEKVDVQYRFVYKKSKNTQDPTKTDNRASAQGSKEGAEGNSGLIPSKKKALTPNATLKEVRARYGDIIIGGMSMEGYED
ncbi:MAG: Unknown protein [uncultured Aureispira sp.]|uniref:Uncharacterized protein n=1 Tax=uncultured Aureispira sp. TaxID=1331704 RepID=A0A6S6SLL5_9BACT|nr:MAG: Unknown protein [uncultured Aureispira sp.]